MKKIIMFIFLSFVISGCGDILDVLNSSALDSDGGGNSSNINSGSSNTSNENDGNISSGSDSSDENGGDSNSENSSNASDGNGGSSNSGNDDNAGYENGDDSNSENGSNTSDGNGDNSSSENGSNTSDVSEVVKFDCYTIYSLDVGCDAIPLSSAVEINEYNWDFGDSSATHSGKYTGPFVEHRYRRSGDYNIKLNVKYTASGIQKTLSYSKPISVKQISFPHVFANGFGAETGKMYYALHITGSSEITGVDRTGLFAQKGNDGFGNGEYKEDFARDLYYLLSGSGVHLKFSESHRAVGVSDFYSNEYGFTDSDGLVFDMPFYFGMGAFNIPINSNGKVYFDDFALEDLTKPAWGGYAYPVFVRCNYHMFNFQIPMNEYDANRHRNIALFTVKFTGACDYTVEFDGFLNK